MDWKPTDSAIRLLNRRAIRRFEKASRQITQFDELNVMPACKQLYQDIAKDNQKVFLELAKNATRMPKLTAKKNPTGHGCLPCLPDTAPLPAMCTNTRLTESGPTWKRGF